ncbi:DUF927 domain-containing protein [Lysinibacillus sp. G4S2]|uniref:DUF927 domain-containing protein n=1 Tax=Lysinibacillus sp. G4S2 TaxID=3055859 RepID=UPI0025A2F3C9|nr:DUF927 domain-containing protein [Lysinibacillus sp. G4S2]MDM5246435.1 DUF927 domain-containing protein [Lysinibacillus sp. G4S2]
MITEGALLVGDSFRFKSFLLNKDGVYRYDAKKEEYEYLCAPVFISYKRQDYLNNQVTLGINYWQNDQFNILEIDAATFNKQMIDVLAPVGFLIPYYFKNYVNAYLILQQQDVKFRKEYHQIGFLARQSKDLPLIYGLSEPISHSETNLQWNEALCRYDLKPNGDFNQWLDMVKKHVVSNPALSFMLGVGFSSMLIGYSTTTSEPLNTQLVHLLGESGSGKTTAAMLALSIFGTPRELGDKSLFSTWNATNNALVNKLTGNYGVPVLFDEFSMSTASTVTSLVYVLASGKDKDRMTDQLKIKAGETWGTAFITTGENSIFERTNRNKGLIVRLHEYDNKQWTTNAEQSNEIKAVVNEHYGHAALVVARYLAESNWSSVMPTIQYWKEQLLPMLPESDVKDRVARKYAATIAALALAGEAMDVEFPLDEVIEFIVQNDYILETQRDLAEVVYRSVIDDVRANANQFIFPNVAQSSFHIKGKIQRYQSFYKVYYIKTEFEKLLQSQGITNFSGIIKMLKRKPYFEADTDRPTQRVVIEKDKGRQNTYVFKIPKAELDTWLG